MKTSKKILLALLITVIGGVYSCKKKVEDEPPTIAVTGPDEAFAGGAAAFKITVSSNATLGTLTIEQSINGSPFTKVKDTTFSNKNSVQWDYSHPVTMNSGDNIVVKFTITDANGLSAKVEKTVKVSAGSANLTECPSETLGNQHHSTGSFLATKGGCVVYNSGEARTNQTKVDLVHYFGNNNGATISSPSDADLDQFNVFAMNLWTSRNVTTLRPLGNAVNMASYNTATDVKAAYDGGGTSTTKATQVGNGYSWAFKTQDGRYGVFKVLSISGNAQSAGTIKLHIKVN